MRKLMITPDPKFKSWLRNNIGGTNTDYIYAEIVEAVTDVVNDLTDPDSTRAWVDTMQDLLLIQIRVDDDPEFAKRDTIRKFVNEIHKIDRLYCDHEGNNRYAIVDGNRGDMFGLISIKTVKNRSLLSLYLTPPD